MLKGEQNGSCRNVSLLILMFSVLDPRRLGGEWGRSWCARDRKSGHSADILEEKGTGCIGNGLEHRAATPWTLANLKNKSTASILLLYLCK